MKHRSTLVFIALLVFLLLFFSPIQYACQTIASCLLYPVLKVSTGLFSFGKHAVQPSKSIAQLRQMLEAVRKRNRTLAAQQRACKSTLYRFGISQEVRDFARRYALDNQPIAYVLSRTLTDNEQSVLVDKGSSDGIEVDMIALDGHKLVGKVVKVFPWYSKVQLITDSQSSVSSFTQQNHSRGIVQADNSTYSLLLRFVSRVDAVALGERVISSGEGLVFPAGFELGSIVYHEKEALYHYIEVKPAFDPKGFKSCLLVARAELR